MNSTLPDLDGLLVRSESHTASEPVSAAEPNRGRTRALSRLLLAGVFLEIGFVLLVVPWTRYWDANYFVEILPRLQPIVSNPYVRGAVSGLGVVNLVAGIAELGALFVAGRSTASPAGMSFSEPPETDRTSR